MNDWIAAPTSYLDRAAQENNVRIIYPFFRNLGWTNEAIAGMLGNMEEESTINPQLWENRVIPDDPYTVDRGYGLTQWTPANKLINWADAEGLDYTDGDTQLKRIEYERQNNIQWQDSTYTFMRYSQDTRDPEILAELFCRLYEAPPDPDLEERARQARSWYEYLLTLPYVPPWLLFQFNKYSKRRWMP